MLRLPLLLCSAVFLLAALSPARAPVAGESRAVIAVMARVVDACSVSVPETLAVGAAGGPGVDQRCTSSAAVPHRISVGSAAAAATGTRAGVRTVQRGVGAAGDVMVVTISY